MSWIPHIARAAVIAVLAALAVSPAFASAASKKLDGTYGGTATHPVPAFLEPGTKPYETRFGAGVLTRGDRGTRVVSLVAEIRMWCGESSIRDKRIFFASSRRNRGIKVSRGGRFSFKRKGVTINAVIAKGAITGTMSGAGPGDCRADNVALEATRR